MNINPNELGNDEIKHSHCMHTQEMRLKYTRLKNDDYCMPPELMKNVLVMGDRKMCQRERDR